MEKAVYLPADALTRMAGRRQELGLTQKQLAQLLNLKQPRLNEMLTGKKPFPLTVLYDVIAILSLPDLQVYIPQNLSETDTAHHACRLALQILGQWLQAATDHDRQEVLFLLAVSMEGKPPYGLNKHSRVLRALANMVPGVKAPSFMAATHD